MKQYPKPYSDLRDLDVQELKAVAFDLRERIMEVVSAHGGHFSGPLGAVELIVGMHHVFDVQKDPFIFDVSHQAYAHKLLTGRFEEFETLRQFEGINGFTNPNESPYDYFVAGHSSTSISLGVGAAKAIRLQKQDRIPVCMIGDGAMSAGLAYEALNELGFRKYPMVIILNDNEMSISKPIGAVSKYLSKALSGSCYQGIKQKIKPHFSKLSGGMVYFLEKFNNALKMITPGVIFEELGIEYIGPIDGHDIGEIIEVMQTAKRMQKPVIIHAQTTKGKGYKPAEGQLEKWHGVGAFCRKSASSGKSTGAKKATNVFSEALGAIVKRDQKVVGVTAAMPTGTGLDALIEAYPDQFFDVGIAEQHAVTSCAAMAKEGLKVYVAIYSTFLQRAYDQIVHDVCILGLPVVFAIDRAGIVGEDGETHQGAFDVGYLRILPNMTVFAPRDNATLRQAIDFSYALQSPCAFRYPRGTFDLKDDVFEALPFEMGKAQWLLDDVSSEAVCLGFGNGVGKAHDVIGDLKAVQVVLDLVDLRFVKPLDEALLKALAKKHSTWFVFSENAKMGGVASALLEFLNANGLSHVRLHSFEYGDAFIEHGSKSKVEVALGLDRQSIAKAIKKALE